MVSVKVLGPGCANCKRLEQVALKAVAEAGIAATVEKVTTMEGIMSYAILSTPGLVINGKVVSSGRIPSKEEIVGWLKAASTERV